MSCPDYVGWGAVRRLSAKEPVIGNRHLRDLVTRRCDRDATPQKAANAASTILPPLRSEPRLLEGAQPEYERTGHGSSGASRRYSTLVLRLIVAPAVGGHQGLADPNMPIRWIVKLRS
jgi:hypothetical protein